MPELDLIPLEEVPLTKGDASRLWEKLEALAEGGEVLDWRGHYKRGVLFSWDWESASERLKKILAKAQRLFVDAQFGQGSALQALMGALEEGALLEAPIVLTPFDALRCPVCGEYLQLGFDGKGFVVLGADCPYPEGFVTEWELNVPSGKLVVANDLREWFPFDKDHNVNYLVGIHLTTLGYAKVGMAHGFVGNTSPCVFREGDRFVIGSYQETLWNEGDDEEHDNPDPCPWGDSITSICTDLWWYSIVDFDEFVRRVPYYTPEVKIEGLLGEGREVPLSGEMFSGGELVVGDHQLTVVGVRPGVYKFRQVQGVNRDESPVEYASFEWVREPDEVRDYLKEEHEKSLNATEVLVEHCLSWPTLYLGISSLDRREDERSRAIKYWESLRPLEKARSLARAADHIMCTLGGGVEWHENGFPRCTVSEEAKRFAAELGEVPPFDFEVHWYPISAGYGGLCLGAGIFNDYSGKEQVKLAPTFVLLGLNICQNAIKFGEKPRLNHEVYPPAYEIPFARERMRLFMSCYLGLRKLYPDLVLDAEVDRWMLGTDPDQYVAARGFGPEHPPKEKWGSPPSTIKKGEFFEFDASLLGTGHFCWHPKKMTAWASKVDAQRYALGIVEDTRSPMGHLHVDCSARNSVPIRTVGRVLQGTGDDGIRSKELVVAFDYGTEKMKAKHWAIRECDMKAVRQFDDPNEYAALLEQCKVAFEIAENSDE